MSDTPNEILGQRCADGGKCHHSCTQRCFRRECCSPFSDYQGPWAYPAQTGKDDTLDSDPTTGPMPVQMQEETALAWMRAMTKELGCEADPQDPDGNSPFWMARRLTQAIAALRAQAQPKPEDPLLEVGIAGAMPGTQGFTMAAFEARQVPVGTRIFIQAPPAPGAGGDWNLAEIVGHAEAARRRAGDASAD